MTRRFALLLLLVLLLLPAHLFAQLTSGTLVGDVMTDGSPLPGVTVSVSSPALQGTRSTVTGKGGGYVLPALPPGDYRVFFDLSGMQKVEQRVTVSVSQATRADANMKVAAVSETVTITAAAPSVIESTTVATNFTSNQINELPISRTIDAVTDLAPGVTSAGPNNQITISGSTSFDNLFLVDGVVVNENLRGQPNPLYIEDAIQETTVLTGGISAEFGRFTGGVVSTITKSGGNEFTGSIRDSLSNPNWSAKTDFAAQADPIDSVNHSFEGTLGGRIVRDRLWFFSAGRYNKQDLSRQTALTNIPFVFSTFDRRFEGKFTGQVTTSQSVVASYIDSRERRTNNVSGGTVVDLRSLAPYSRPKNLLSINYNGVLSPQLLLEGQFSRMRDRFTNGAETRDLINGTLLVDDDQGVRGWSPTFCGSPCPAKVRNNKGYLGKASYFLSTRATGNHNFVGGYEEFHQLRNENNYQSGSDLRIHGTYIIVGDKTYFGIDPNVGQIEYDPVPALSKTSDFATRSVFVNDKWDFNRHFSFNIG
ncbi:MAG TPA: carboxypeptidase regulatory-like domain-containing protein, partial [Thermoanaerobaculia bacterium]|nr:carboxypeptidase regulatory-like domain-containing protein [Thermoanaerobaculia bacterium]